MFLEGVWCKVVSSIVVYSLCLNMILEGVWCNVYNNDDVIIKDYLVGVTVKYDNDDVIIKD